MQTLKLATEKTLLIETLYWEAFEFSSKTGTFIEEIIKLLTFLLLSFFTMINFCDFIFDAIGFT